MATSVEIQPWKRNICGVLQQNQGMAKAIPCHTEPSAPVLSGKGIDTPVLVCSQITCYVWPFSLSCPISILPWIAQAIDNDVDLMVICWRWTELELRIYCVFRNNHGSFHNVLGLYT